MNMIRHVLSIVENQSVPQDKRVWNEAKSIRDMGYDVSVICPKNKFFNRRYEEIDGIKIYRHPSSKEGNGISSFLFEYLNAIFWELFISIKIFITR